MSLDSQKFFAFIMITVITYYICLPKLRWIVLLAANIGFFLSTCSLGLFGVFTFMTLATWGAALLIATAKKERQKSIIAGASIIALALVLISYKEISFFIINSHYIEKILPVHFGWTIPNWAAPLGISYFTLILIGYLLDVRWGTVKVPQKNPLKMLTFAGYFPHMTSGPFTRYNDIKDTLFGVVKLRFSNIINGLQRIIWGVFKVVVISTRLSVLVATIYDVQTLPLAENHYAGIAVIGGAMLYVLYVYINFSGSMDIVIGVSELFGIPLAENFKRPFSATSLSEIWRRWHMTLGFWLKDYVLYPTLKSAWLDRIRRSCKKRMGKKAAKDIPTYIGMLITWFCVGFWHGGSWKYICGSGLFFFVMIVGGILLEPAFDRLVKLLHINTACASWRWLRQARSFCLFSFSVSFGRAASLTDGFHMWQNLSKQINLQVLFDGTIFDMGLQERDVYYVFIGLFAVFLVSYLQQQYGSVRKLLSRQNFLFRLSVIGILLAMTFLIGGLDTKIDFIYGNF